VGGTAAIGFANGATTNGGITLNSGNLTTGTNGGSATVNGAVTGVGSISINRLGGGTHTLNLNSTANTFTGTVSLTGTALITLNINSLSDSASLGAGNIRFAASAGSSVHTFALGSGAVAPVTLNNRRIELVAGSSAAYTIANNSSQAFTINTDLLVGVTTGSPVLTLGGTGPGLSSFNGIIANGSAPSLGLTKSEGGTWVLGNSANSYTGATQVQAGTLVVNKLADFSANSSIGAASSGAIILGNGNNTGTLLYTGGAQETNRTIQVNSTNNTNTGGATIVNNGTGALTFDAPIFNAAYTNASTVTRTLTLGGTNGGTISGTIQNNSATNSVGLTKTGAGTWEISSTSSNFTGATTVNSGKLKLTGAIGATSALVMGGGTFEVNPSAASQTMASLAVTATTAGSNIIVGSGKTLAITSGTFSLANWTAVNFDISASSSVITLPVASKDTYLGTTSAMATVLDSTGFGFAAVNPSNQIYRLTSTLLPASGASSSTFYRVDNNNTDPGSGAGTGIGGNNLTITATQTVGSLVVDTTARSGMLTLASGAILKSNEFAFGSTAASSGNTYTITGSAGGSGIGQAVGNNNINVSNYGGTVNFESPFLSTGSGYINFSGTGTTVLKGTNVYTGATKVFGSGTLQIGAAGSLNSGNYAGNIEINGSSTLQYSSSTNQTLGGIISGTGALIKDTSASSVLTLTGANSYSGGTTVSGGMLLVSNTTGSGTGTGAVSVAAAAILGGNGTVGGATTLAGTSIHAPGSAAATVGKQSFSSSVTYNSGSIFEWNLAATPSETGRGTSYDAVNAASLGVTSGAIFRVVLDGAQDFSESFWNTNRTWSDIFKTGDAGSNLSIASIFTGTTQYYNVNSGDLGIPTAQGSFTISGSNLNWTAIPEPSTALGGLLLTAGLLRRRRKQTEG
jgi:fibronectin-binding autotransporter adhesin